MLHDARPTDSDALVGVGRLPIVRGLITLPVDAAAEYTIAGAAGRRHADLVNQATVATTR